MGAATASEERDDSRRRRRAWSIAAAAAIAALVALGLAWREYASVVEQERLRFLAEVEEHTAILASQVTERVTMARAVAAAFQPPAAIAPGALSQVDPELLASVPDIFSFVWIPRVEAADAPAALEALRGAGLDAAAFFGPGRRPLAPEELTDPFYPVLDILPRSEANLRSLGLAISSLDLPQAALAEAVETGRPAATAPLQLVQLPGVAATVIYVPVFARNGPARRAVGYLGFSYPLDRLVGSALARMPNRSLAVRVVDAAADPDQALVFELDAWPGYGEPVGREIGFAGRPWRVEYALAQDPRAAATRAALAVGAVAGAAAAGVAFAFLYVMRLNQRLGAALEARKAAEGRLRTLVDELDHRGKNMLTVVQAVVSQTLRGDAAKEEAREALERRLFAMARSTTLLVESEWRGVPMRRLVSQCGLPFPERVALEGPAIVIAPGAAQTLTLVVHELWTNATKHGALSAPEGSVRLSWSVDGGRFALRWRESGGPQARLPETTGFGRQLIERLAPRSLGGEGALEAGASGVDYRLAAPADRVVVAQASAA